MIFQMIFQLLVLLLVIKAWLYRADVPVLPRSECHPGTNQKRSFTLQPLAQANTAASQYERGGLLRYICPAIVRNTIAEVISSNYMLVSA
ncbi:hypothetical protein BZA70DRAFT_104033 [Myxozyma melibiosi]|uniref:Secreted protein n=1 Tax=Myxozyma melibiosi TaxID=54550 RepID=A0ABR1EXR3_9ASCO